MHELLEEAFDLLIEINNDLAAKQDTEGLTEKEKQTKHKLEDNIRKIRESGIFKK